MAQVVNTMIWLFFPPQYMQSAHHKVDLNHKIQWFEIHYISFSVKKLDYVPTGFISSNLKSSESCEDKECEGTNEHHKSNVFFKKKETFVYLVSSAGRLKWRGQFKGWVRYQRWQTLKGGQGDMAGLAPQDGGVPDGRKVWVWGIKSRTVKPRSVTAGLVLQLQWQNILISTTVRFKSKRQPWFLIFMLLSKGKLRHES